MQESSRTPFLLSSNSSHGVNRSGQWCLAVLLPFPCSTRRNVPAGPLVTSRGVTSTISLQRNPHRSPRPNAMRFWVSSAVSRNVVASSSLSQTLRPASSSLSSICIVGVAHFERCNRTPGISPKLEWIRGVNGRILSEIPVFSDTH